MTTREVWTYVPATPAWKRYGWIDIATSGDGFAVGTTLPTTSNTGCRVSEESLIGTANEITGDVYLTTPGQTYSGKLVHGSIFVQAANVTIEDVIVDVPMTSGADRHAIVNWHAAATGNVIRFVTIRCQVANQSYWIGSGIHGSGFEATRVQITGMTDGITMAGVSKRSYARAYGCWIDRLVHYDYDGYPGKTGSHSDGSHPDGIVMEGNLTEAVAVGNSIAGNYTSGMFFTQNQGTFDTAPVVTDNWFRNDGGTIGSYVNLTKGGMTSIATLGVVFKRNRYMYGVGTTSGGPAKAYIPSALLVTMQSLGQITSSGADRPVFLDAGGAPTAAVVQVYTGSASLTTY